MTRTATCACGSLSIVLSGEPKHVALCNCLQCQKRTGSAFGLSSFFNRKDIVAINGAHQAFQRKALETRTVEEPFCPACGSTVFWYGSVAPETVVVHAYPFSSGHRQLI